MNTNIFKILFFAIMLGMSGSVSAQGFLKSLKKAATEAVAPSEGAAEGEAADSTQNKLNEKDFPAYTAQKVYVLDENNQRIKNEDGTDKYIVQLIRTSDGVVVSPEVASAQAKQINEAILAIAAKAAAGGAMGYLSGGGKGALIGVASGLGLSVADIILVIKLKKDSNKQKKALEAYKKSFDEEGNPTTAKVDKETIKLLNLNDDNAVEKTTAAIKEELSKPEYSTPVENESIDALISAATKA